MNTQDRHDTRTAVGTAAAGTPGAIVYPVMILAHNEERHIEACLDSIFTADPGMPLEAYVMANGCTDSTEAVVLRYREKNPNVHLVSIKLGDKCNAWNVFVHETVPGRCPGQPLYFFMDGDARATPGSFSAMVKTMHAHPEALAVGVPPASGRSMARDRELLLRNHELVANLYALTGPFVEDCQRKSVRIPLKLEGDDGLIGALVKWNLDPTKEPRDEYIAPCGDAGFIFQSFDLGRVGDWKTYWKRMVRYGRRQYEFALLGPRLKKHGLAAMPADIRELYAHAGELEMSWNGMYSLTNWVALKQMRKIGETISPSLSSGRPTRPAG